MNWILTSFRFAVTPCVYPATIAKRGTGFWKGPYRTTRISTVAKWDYGSRENQYRAGNSFLNNCKMRMWFREKAWGLLYTFRLAGSNHCHSAIVEINTWCYRKPNTPPCTPDPPILYKNWTLFPLWWERPKFKKKFKNKYQINKWCQLTTTWTLTIYSKKRNFILHWLRRIVIALFWVNKVVYKFGINVNMMLWIRNDKHWLMLFHISIFGLKQLHCLVNKTLIRS